MTQTIRTLLYTMLSFVSVWTSSLAAQGLTLATVTRPPFSMVENDVDTGFAIDLWQALVADLGRETTIVRVDTFADMFEMVTSGQVNAAAANISITAAREIDFDFTQPIFSAGLQVMVPKDSSGFSIWRTILSAEILLSILGAFAALLGCGMLMWRFEHRDQDYFKQGVKESLFPSFWWALNLVVNGGFEERVPRSPMGRLFGVFLVISSLFIVSIFVASITAAMTVDAIQSSVNSVNDLYEKRVGTTEGSTASTFLTDRDIEHASYTDFTQLIGAFEAGELQAVVFDAPILAYYVNTSGSDKGQLAGPVLLPESYGIVLPSGSSMAEELNQSLLKLRENGTYNALRIKWFGMN
jgi:polar amino acid transport system substrate-binding protein